MKKLIITGIPCPAHSWQRLFPIESEIEQKIVPFITLFSEYYYQNNSIKDLVSPLAAIIEDFAPDQIILHDIGVTIGILALTNAIKRGYIPNHQIIIFNGAFIDFDVNKSSHPVRIQSMTFQEFKKEVTAQNGEVDPAYESHFPTIQLLYRQITETSREQIANPKQERLINLGGPTLIIASRNDPYIHFECLEILKQIIEQSLFNQIDYGHFPYSGDINLIMGTIINFQKNIFL